MTVLLVRHGHAGDRDHWDLDDGDRPLSELGRAQAEALVRTLAGHAVDRVMSSPTVRCVQTVAPLAAARGLRVEEDQRLLETAPNEVVEELLAALGSEAAVVCTHGDVVAALIATARLRGANLEPDPQWEKGSTWVLELDGGRVTAGAYLPPPV